MPKKKPVRTLESGVRTLPKPDYSVCQLHSNVGELLTDINQLPDAATVLNQRLRSCPLELLPMLF
ncbi:hypothetical protein WBJ53_25965 [Spirosoma sp. SC4-14]|uniref:hypothetical protein n=1 Tax=Spirosoma sp. SC4-14 TaxID=3128900 RepID=UPI0030CB7C80